MLGHPPFLLGVQSPSRSVLFSLAAPCYPPAIRDDPVPSHPDQGVLYSSVTRAQSNVDRGGVYRVDCDIHGDLHGCAGTPLVIGAQMGEVRCI